MQPKASYSSTRLHFKAAIIESLSMNDEFQIVTPIGTWRMSKSDFYSVFPNVISSASYSGGRGEYHYKNPPAKSDQFKVQNQRSSAVNVFVPGHNIATAEDIERQLQRLEAKIRSV